MKDCMMYVEEVLRNTKRDIESISERGNISPDELCYVKDWLKVKYYKTVLEAMEDDKYSYRENSYRGNSRNFASMGRDSMGRYANKNYSRDKKKVMELLEEAMEEIED